MKIVLSTRNKHKIDEIQMLLSQYLKNIQVLSLDDVGFVGDIEENGTTFEENAMIKARAAAKASGLISIADDSGLTVDALNNAPGIYSARYSGADGADRDNENNKKLLKELQGVANRSAQFVCSIACAFPDNMNAADFTVTGITYGEILCNERGKGGFGYDPLFWIDELGKTYAEMSTEEKNKYSHRGRAIMMLAGRFQNMIVIE